MASGRRVGRRAGGRTCGRVGGRSVGSAGRVFGQTFSPAAVSIGTDGRREGRWEPAVGRERLLPSPCPRIRTGGTARAARRTERRKCLGGEGEVRACVRAPLRACLFARVHPDRKIRIRVRSGRVKSGGVGFRCVWGWLGPVGSRVWHEY